MSLRIDTISNLHYINKEQNGEDLQVGLVKKGHIWNLFKNQQKLGGVLWLSAWEKSDFFVMAEGSGRTE